jgi:hypothetical protein
MYSQMALTLSSGAVWHLQIGPVLVSLEAGIELAMLHAYTFRHAFVPQIAAVLI